MTTRSHQEPTRALHFRWRRCTSSRPMPAQQSASRPALQTHSCIPFHPSNSAISIEDSPRILPSSERPIMNGNYSTGTMDYGTSTVRVPATSSYRYWNDHHPHTGTTSTCRVTASKKRTRTTHKSSEQPATTHHSPKKQIHPAL